MCLPIAAAAAASMTSLQVASLALGVVGTGLSAYQSYQGAKVQGAVAAQNARTAEMQARDALRRGDEQAERIGREGARVRGTQRAVMAARGLDLSEGTAASLQEETSFLVSEDIRTTQRNAQQEAQGFRMRGAGYAAQAQNANPLMAGGSTLLTGAGQVADRWLRYRGT